uniref:Uncharacterized protein n=1 Tax=Anguilla anguilla TaxID=7936 RepID=A0A0E9SXB5_ANGAN
MLSTTGEKEQPSPCHLVQNPLQVSSP